MCPGEKGGNLQAAEQRTPTRVQAGQSQLGGSSGHLGQVPASHLQLLLGLSQALVPVACRFLASVLFCWFFGFFLYFFLKSFLCCYHLK